MSQAQQVDPNLVEALRRKVSDLADRVETLEEENRDLRAKVEVLEDRTPDPNVKEYGSMDKHDKATVVQTKMIETAKATNGKASMSYKDVISVFDGQPSPGHAYDIMELVGERDGYNYGSAPGGSKRVTVDASSVNDTAALSRRE